MEVLNHCIRWAEREQFLTRLASTAKRCRASLYADDLVLFVVPEAGDLHTVKSVFNIFGSASGLFTNMDKSVATPLHCSDQDIENVRNILSCKIEELPTRYLGVPLALGSLWLRI